MLMRVSNRATRVAVVLGVLTLLADSVPAAMQPTGTAHAWIEEAFAALEGRDLQGRTITAASLRGRVVVLDFWATWCAPCLAELPTFQRLRRAHDPSTVEIISVSVDVLDRRGLVTWLKRHDVTWTQVHDGRGYNGRLAQQFRVATLPTTYVFNGEGRLVAMNLRGERLAQTVAALVHVP